jgi:hypothetical protein
MGEGEVYTEQISPIGVEEGEIFMVCFLQFRYWLQYIVDMKVASVKYSLNELRVTEWLLLIVLHPPVNDVSLDFLYYSKSNKVLWVVLSQMCRSKNWLGCWRWWWFDPNQLSAPGWQLQCWGVVLKGPQVWVSVTLSNVHIHIDVPSSLSGYTASQVWSVLISDMKTLLFVLVVLLSIWKAVSWVFDMIVGSRSRW